MLLLVLMGVMGAVIGAWAKPRLLALPAALALAAGARALIGVFASVGVAFAPVLARLAFHIVQDGDDDYLPLLAVTGGGALFSLVLGLLLGRRSRRAMTLEEATRARRRIRQGKFVRAPGMVAPRERQSEAEARNRSILEL